MAPVRKAWVKKNPDSQKTWGLLLSYQSCRGGKENTLVNKTKVFPLHEKTEYMSMMDLKTILRLMD